MGKTLSIITANFNNAPYLNAFFESIVNSTMLPTDLVFIDDASTDNSLKIAEQWKEKAPFPIIIIKLTINRGFANALNEAIAQSTGDFLLRIDPDDFMHEDRIKEEWNYLIQNKEIDVVGSNTFYFNHARKKIVGKSFFPSEEKKIEEGIRKGIITLSNGSYTARRDVLEQIPYQQEYFGFEEYDLFARMITNEFRIHTITKHLTYYRIDNQNRSLQHMLRVQKGMALLRAKYFKKELCTITIFFRSLSSYLYWRALKADKGWKFLLFFTLAIPFKFRVSRLITILKRHEESAC